MECKTVFYYVYVIASLATAIPEIVIGSLYVNSCPVEIFIPIWLLVGGTVTVLAEIIKVIKFGVLHKTSNDDSTNDGEGKYSLCDYVFTFVVVFFDFGWFIAGNVWVFQRYVPNTIMELHPDYCNPVAYYFAFGLIIVHYIIGGLLLGTFVVLRIMNNVARE